jgi:hypothetical protein
MSKMLWLFLKDIFTLFIFLNNNFILGFKNLFHTTKHRLNYLIFKIIL